MNKTLKPISKIELIEQFKAIESRGWIENNARLSNDGTIGNLLEDLLGIPENNLPIPNAAEWELKTQRDNTSSLLTLFHLEPSPRALNIVTAQMLPNYGWAHQQAGTKYPYSEMSFRATLKATTYTRGFIVEVDRNERKVLVRFDAGKVLEKDKLWLESIHKRMGSVEDLNPSPYWGFDDLFSKARTKLLNCFFVIAEQKREGDRRFCHFYKVIMLQNLSIDKFLGAVEQGDIYIDFDARTGHNHGTKFRIKASAIPQLYQQATIVIDMPKFI